MNFLHYLRNRGKPTLERFDTEFKRECVLDYMIDLSDTVSLAKTMSADYGVENLIPISRDPFGNLIAFRIAGRQVDGWCFGITKRTKFIEYQVDLRNL